MRVFELRSDIDQDFARFLKEEIKSVEKKYGHLTEEEFSQLNEEQLNEWIPLVLGALGAGWEIYDKWNKYSPAYKAAGGGKAGWNAIKKDLGNELMGDAAVLGLLGGAGKLGSVGWKLGKRAWDAKKAAKLAANQKGLKTIGQKDIPVPNTTPLITAKSGATGAASTAAGVGAASKTDWDKWADIAPAH